MLETLVSSRIRRTLLECLLQRPTERFYLRGLAKELGLPVSPLHRELKRLQRAGILHAAQVGNMLFYAINPDSQVYLFLKQAGLPGPTRGSAGERVPGSRHGMFPIGQADQRCHATGQHKRHGPDLERGDVRSGGVRHVTGDEHPECGRRQKE